MADRDEAKQSERDRAEVKRHVVALMEHFDTVQIFCTRHHGKVNDSSTYHVQNGDGNYFARVGQVTEWLNLERAALVSEALGRRESPEGG